MYRSVVNVSPLSDYRLELTFENKEIRLFDVKPYLETGIFAELKNPSLFQSVRIGLDTVEWKNGIDLDPEELYGKSRPK